MFKIFFAKIQNTDSHKQLGVFLHPRYEQLELKVSALFINEKDIYSTDTMSQKKPPWRVVFVFDYNV